MTPIRLAELMAVQLAALAGWTVGGLPGAGIGGAAALVAAVIPWWGRPLWSWLALWRRRDRPPAWPDPVTVANDRAGGGVRQVAGTAVAAVQVLGRRHRPTLFTGSTAAVTEDVLDVATLLPLLHQSLGLELESMSVISTGARRRPVGDYPRIYDTLIGTPPYAGTRQTWLILRVAELANAQALQHRISAGSAVLAAAQRVVAALRESGVRARVAGCADIAELERHLGTPLRERRWRSVRTDAGWLSSYGYRPADITAASLAAAWTLRVDGLTQNLTLYPDDTMTATVTVRTNQRPSSPPSVRLTGLPGEQADAVAACGCGPTLRLGGLRTGPVPPSLPIPIGPSGVLIGRSGAGNRLALPLVDPGEYTRVLLDIDDELAKRLIIRAAGAGERVTVHSRDESRWAALRMPGIVVTDGARPAPDSTLSVVDGPVTPTPRPAAVARLGPAGLGDADIVVAQAGPGRVEIRTGGRVYPVEMELFRAENRYAQTSPGDGS
ncbi:MAG: type VII secretion protein EccE [Mycolicibacterium insubricum]